MRDRMVGGGLMALALVALIGCSSTTGGSSAPASSAPESAAASAAAPSAAAPSEAAASQAAASEGAFPSFLLPSDAKELEALIPDTICGAKVTKTSMKGADIFSNGDDPTISAVLSSLGKTPADVSAAAAFVLSGDSPCGVFIFRIQGADEGKLRDIFKQLADKEGTKYSDASIGGKSVEKVEPDPGESGLSKFQYAYVKGDGLISVAADTEAHAADIISQLP
jgi:hypothetical protein